MFQIQSNGSEVVVTIESGIPHPDGGPTHFPVRWNAGTAYAAYLLAEHLRSHLNNLVTDVRREEYESGWTAAKAKKHGKRTWFSSLLRKGMAH